MLPMTPPPPPVQRKRWTARECERLVAVGVLEAGQFELLEGEIVRKMGQNPPHVLVVSRLIFALGDAFGRDFIQSQAPLHLSEESEPEPDISVLARPLHDFLQSGTPEAVDARLVVEVSDATLTVDRTHKARLYARANLPEYWIADIEGRRLIVHRLPHPESGEFAEVRIYAEDETVSPLGAPGTALRVRDLLP